MDTNQTTQMITWLDEEHRRDKAMLTEMRQRVESQTIEINDLAKRINELEGRLAGTQAKLTRFNTLEQAMQQLKDELVLMVRDQEANLSVFQRDLNKGRQLEQESTSRAINELRRNLEVIPPLQERLTILRAEDQRLGEAVLNIQTRLTAHERSTAQLPDRITYVEGQRAQDVKAVSQLQEEVNELFRRIENHVSKLELVDDMARKNEQRVTGLASFREDLTRRQSQLIEDVRLKDALRDQQMQDWQAEVARFGEEMGKQRKVLERFARQQDEAQQYLASIEDYKDTLNREQRQIAEHQRMSEERQRREFEEWIAAQEQRWTKFRLEREAQWHQANSRHEEVVNRIKQLEGWRGEDVERVQKIMRDLILIQEEYRSKVQELWTIHERTAVFQLEQVRRWYDEISGVVQEKLADGRR